MGMESSLQKVLRLAAVSVHQYRRVRNGRVQNVRQYSQGRRTGTPRPAGHGLRLGTPYRAAWSNVNVGDVLQFGAELWKVIAATAYPGYKPPVKRSGSGSKGTGKQSGGSSTGTGSKKTTGSGSSTGTGNPGGAGHNPGVQTFTHYLQNVHDPRQFDRLTLPSTYVATVVPILP